jgi:hypothetical protein
MKVVIIILWVRGESLMEARWIEVKYDGIRPDNCTTSWNESIKQAISYTRIPNANEFQLSEERLD